MTLSEELETTPLALLLDQDRVYFARGSLEPGGLDTPVIRLIQGIYETEPKQAKRLLRKRIYSNRPLTVACRGTLRVAAKRAHAPVELSTHLAPDATPIEVGGAPKLDPVARELGEWLTERLTHCNDDLARSALCCELRDRTAPPPGSPWSHQRHVACYLLSKESELLGWAATPRSLNRALHAEVLLLLGLGQRVPRGARLYTSLKCCRMCASWLWQAAEDWREIRVIYAEPDLGRQSWQTVLGANTPDRREACADPRDRGHFLEEHIEARLGSAG